MSLWRLILIAGLILAALHFALLTWQRSQFMAWDFAINWTAARGMLAGVSLYDGPAQRAMAVVQIGPAMAGMWADRFTSFISPPSTALFLVPFALIPFPLALVAYRLTALGAFFASVGIAAGALPKAERIRGLAIGLAAILLLDAVSVSLQLGQLDAFVMVALAGGMWAASKDRWTLAGVLWGLAALLKISPALLIVYALMRGKWRTAAGAALVLISLAVAGAIRPVDLARFFTDILPAVSAGTLHVQNQSLPAWVARLMMPQADFQDYGAPLGLIRWLGPAFALGVLALLAWRRRGLPPRIVEFGIVILATLLMGPVTWDHYTAWAAVAVIPAADSEVWAKSGRRRLVAGTIGVLGLVLLALPTLYGGGAFLSGTKMLGLLLWLAVGLLMA